MRFKHFLLLLTLVCALAECGMALYAMHWEDIINQIACARNDAPDRELAVVRSLNFALPLGLGCLLFLGYTWRINSIGGFAIFTAVVLHMIGADLSLRAAKKVYGDHTPLASVAWWAPPASQG